MTLGFEEWRPARDSFFLHPTERPLFLLAEEKEAVYRNNVSAFLDRIADSADLGIEKDLWSLEPFSDRFAILTIPGHYRGSDYSPTVHHFLDFSLDTGQVGYDLLMDLTIDFCRGRLTNEMRRLWRSRLTAPEIITTIG